MKNLLYIIIIGTISNTYSAGSNYNLDSILIERNITPSTCYDYFIVSANLEPEIKYRGVLGAYIYKSLVDVYDCDYLTQEILDSLYSRPSFIETIFLFYNDSSYVNLSHFEKDYRWKENYDNLLRNCNNLDLLHKIADSLLVYNMSNGVSVLWDRLIYGKLEHIDNYISNLIDNDNMYKLSEIVIILHNIKKLCL